MLDLKKILRVLSAVLPLIFTHYCAIFLDRAVRDIKSGGDTGLSKGLLFLNIGQIIGASVSMVDGVIRIYRGQDMPLYTVLARFVAYIFLPLGLHKILRALDSQGEESD